MNKAIDRRSMVIGACGLAIAQVLLAGAFWLGFRNGRSQEPGEQAVPTVTSTTTTSTTTFHALASEGEDPCAESFMEAGVCLLGASLDAEGLLIVELEYRNTEADEIGFDGLHGHLFLSDLAVETVGAAGEASIGGGEWTITDATTLRVGLDDQGYLSRTGEVCVATAGPTHTLLHLHASCAPIED